MIYCLQKSFLPMDAISGATGSSSWSEDPKLMQRLDETYRKHLRPHIYSDGSGNSVAKAAWESYCLELSDVFSEQFVDWESETPFFQNLSREYDSLGPMITSSYIEDLSSLWTEVHPALLEVNAQSYSVFAGLLTLACAGYPMARTVHRLWTRLSSRDATVRRYDRTRASRTRAVQLEAVQRPSDVLKHVCQQRKHSPTPTSHAPP
jgi:hypothetical protein